MGLATVITDIAPIYERPNVESLRADEALYGMSVQVIQQSDMGWSYVRCEYGVEGYTPTACLETDAEVASAWRKYKKMTVLAPYIDVNQKPSAASARTASLPRGGILVSLGSSGTGGWVKVGLPNGGIGFTPASYIGEAITDWGSLAPADMRWNLVETALSYMGAAWRHGGRTPMGIDAAGLAAMSYQLNGVSIPREPFFKPGGALHPVKQSDMDEGDVLYFTEGVGIAMGDGRFVHATLRPGAEGVVVGSLRPKDEDYRPELAGSIVTVASLY